MPADVRPQLLAAAPDGSVWSFEARMALSGPIDAEWRQGTHTMSDGSRTSLPLNLGPNGTKQVAMIVGPDGVVWITSSEGADAVTGDVVRIDPSRASAAGGGRRAVQIRR